MPLLLHNGKRPRLGERTFIAENATLIGEVTVGDDSSVWFNAVLRADFSSIKVGKGSNIQDNCVFHGDTTDPVIIGNGTSVGHNAIVHGCKIGNRCLIGMGSIIMNKVEVGDECLIAAGALITQGNRIPSRSLVVGIPGKIVRRIEDADLRYIERKAEEYLKLKESYRSITNSG